MIYIECYPDLSLVRSLVSVSRREIVHNLKGKFEICKLLVNKRDCIAILDEDPNKSQPPFINETIIEEDLDNEGIKLRFHRQTMNHLVVLCPDLEGWILKTCQEAQVDIRDYGLPNDARRLHSEINLVLEKFERLLNDLKQISARMKTLKSFLEKYR